MTYRLMTKEAAQTNDLFRRLMGQARYQWAWRKLQSARLYALQSLTVEVAEEDVERGDVLMTYGDVG
jgi:hypothetical protein